MLRGESAAPASARNGARALITTWSQKGGGAVEGAVGGVGRGSSGDRTHHPSWEISGAQGRWAEIGADRTCELETYPRLKLRPRQHTARVEDLLLRACPVVVLRLQTPHLHGTHAAMNGGSASLGLRLGRRPVGFGMRSVPCARLAARLCRRRRRGLQAAQLQQPDARGLTKDVGDQRRSAEVSGGQRRSAEVNGGQRRSAEVSGGQRRSAEISGAQGSSGEIRGDQGRLA